MKRWKIVAQLAGGKRFEVQASAHKFDDAEEMKRLLAGAAAGMRAVGFDAELYALEETEVRVDG